jgi:hypothetical protein
MLARKAVRPSERRCLFVGSAVVANLPDLDILPGLLRGNPLAFHHQETHSLAAAAPLWKKQVRHRQLVSTLSP